MALNNSGKISLAGATSGESIAIELGKSATGLISMNDTDVRALAGISSGMIRLGDFYGKSSASYWIRRFDLTGTNGGLSDLLASPFGSDYMIMAYKAFTSVQVVNILKIKFDGTIVFNNGIRGSFSDGVIDFSNSPTYIFPDNSFILPIRQRISSSNWPYPTAVRFNSDMTSIDYASWTGSTATTISAQFAYNPASNRYILTMGDDRGCMAFNGTNGNPIGSGIRSNGTGTENGANGYVGAFDSSDNFYVSFTNHVLKLNSSMVVQWAFQFDAATGHGSVIRIDDNKFILAYGKTNFGANICAFDASGNVLWSRRIFDNTVSYRAQLTKDSSGNIYAGFSINSSVNAVKYIYKFDSDGNQIWQRSITSSPAQASVTTPLGNIEIGTDGNMYIGYTLRNAEGYLLKLPTDGSMTGSYTIGGRTIIYAPSSNTVTTTSISRASFGTPITTSLSFGFQNPTLPATSTTSSLVTI